MGEGEKGSVEMGSQRQASCWVRVVGRLVRMKQEFRAFWQRVVQKDARCEV